MRLAFFGLAYHEKTRSSRFFLDVLRQHAEVTEFHAEPDLADCRRRAAGFREEDFDAILIWQLHEAFGLLSGRHPNVTFAPMYDAMFRGGAFRWKPSFSRAKLLSFSWALRQEVMGRVPALAQVQYYPDPAAHRPAADFDALRGFLWYRRRDIPPQSVFARTAGARFARMTIHDAPDPGHEAPGPWHAPAHVDELRRTIWSADGRAFAEALADANVFFASRPAEGIGMSFLEAMASGLCVVAPDAPTMNEYISHGVNGLLHAPGAEAPLDFAAARALGARAREDVAAGHARWLARLPGLMDFIATPTARLAARAGHRAVTRPRWQGTPAEILPIAAPDAPLPPEGAPWLIFLPPGDALVDPEAQFWLLDHAPPGADLVCGHHLMVMEDGSEKLCRVASLEAAWARLLAGEVQAEGPIGFPIRGATAFRREALARLGAVPSADAASHAGLLLRARAQGLEIHYADAIFARHAAPPAGLADRAWAALVAERAGEVAQRGFLRALARARRDTAEARARARPARLVMGTIGAIDRVSPRLGRLAETLLLGGLARRLRRALGRGATP